MFRCVKPMLNGLKNALAPLGKYVPPCVKKEVATMDSGVKSLCGKIKKSYYLGNICGVISGRNKFGSFVSGVVSVFTNTKISKKDIPSLCALAGTCAPVLGGNVVGYAVGRAVTAKPMARAVTTGKKVVTKTCSRASNLFKI